MKDNQLVLPFCRTAYNYDRDAASIESGLKCEDKSLTKQSFLEETDINAIVERFGLTGELPKDVRAPQYGDFDVVIDYHSALNAIAQANEAFGEMPAKTRARFGNDAGAFVDFCADPANRVEMEKMGLLIVDPEMALKKAPQGTETNATEEGEGKVLPKKGKVTPKEDGVT